MTEEPRKDNGPCERCGKHPASVHVRRISGGTEERFHVCPACAKEMGADPLAESGGMLSDPLSVLFKSMAETRESGAVCPGCGLRYSRFRETGRLGCARCYETFAEELKPLLRRIHGGVEHVGKSPTRKGALYEEASRIKRLTAELERAVVSEDYEQAAEIRDRLKELGVTAAGGEQETRR